MTRAHVRNALNTKNTMKLADANPCPDETDTVVPVETSISVTVVPNPTRSDRVARHKHVSAKGSSMIGPFVTQISTMTVHVLHGKTQSVLNTNHRLVTSKSQLHVSAGLDRAQTNTSSMHGIIKNT